MIEKNTGKIKIEEIIGCNKISKKICDRKPEFAEFRKKSGNCRWGTSDGMGGLLPAEGYSAGENHHIVMQIQAAFSDPGGRLAEQKPM